VTRRSSAFASSTAPPAPGPRASSGPPRSKLVSGLIATGVSVSVSVSSAPESADASSNAAVAGAKATVSFRDDAVSGEKPRAGRGPLCVSRGAQDDDAGVLVSLEDDHTLALCESVATAHEGADPRRSLTGASSLSRDAARPPTGGSRAAAGGDDAFFSVSGSAGSRAAIAALARAARGEDDDVVIAREARVRVRRRRWLRSFGFQTPKKSRFPRRRKRRFPRQDEVAIRPCHLASATAPISTTRPLLSRLCPVRAEREKGRCSSAPCQNARRATVRRQPRWSR
jgi:hypothetical protein